MNIDDTTKQKIKDIVIRLDEYAKLLYILSYYPPAARCIKKDGKCIGYPDTFKILNKN